jgi:hypothetical protein
VNNYHAIKGDKPLSYLSSIATSRPLDATLAMYALYLSLVSITTLRILTWSLGLIVYSLIVKGSYSNLCALGVKCIIVVLSTLNITLLLLS